VSQRVRKDLQELAYVRRTPGKVKEAGQCVIGCQEEQREAETDTAAAVTPLVRKDSVGHA
jgi:hypothetical protein